MTPVDIWQELDIPMTANKRAIKKAYSVRLKQVRPDVDPEGFKRLREAYDLALKYAADNPDVETDAAANQPASHATLQHIAEDLAEDIDDDIIDAQLDDDDANDVVFTVEQLDDLIGVNRRKLAAEDVVAASCGPTSSDDATPDDITLDDTTPDEPDPFTAPDQFVQMWLGRLHEALCDREDVAIALLQKLVTAKPEWPVDVALDFDCGLFDYLCRVRPPAMYLTAFVVEAFHVHERLQMEKQSSELFPMLQHLMGMTDNHRYILDVVAQSKFSDEAKQLFGQYQGDVSEAKVDQANDFMEWFYDEFDQFINVYFRDDILEHWWRGQANKVIRRFRFRLKNLVLVERQAAEHFLNPDEQRFFEFVRDPVQAKAFCAVAGKLQGMNAHVFGSWAPGFIQKWLASNTEESLSAALMHEQNILQYLEARQLVFDFSIWEFARDVILVLLLIHFGSPYISPEKVRQAPVGNDVQLWASKAEFTVQDKKDWPVLKDVDYSLKVCEPRFHPAEFSTAAQHLMLRLRSPKQQEGLAAYNKAQRQVIFTALAIDYVYAASDVCSSVRGRSRIESDARFHDGGEIEMLRWPLFEQYASSLKACFEADSRRPFQVAAAARMARLAYPLDAATAKSANLSVYSDADFVSDMRQLDCELR